MTSGRVENWSTWQKKGKSSHCPPPAIDINNDTEET